MQNNIWWENIPVKERQAQGRTEYTRYGYHDALFAKFLERKPTRSYDKDATWYSVSVKELQASYQQAYTETEQKMQHNRTAMYMQELVSMLEDARESEEWYADDFDKPLWLAKQVWGEVQQ